MIAIPGYTIIDVLSTNSSIALLRAEKAADGTRVLLKIPLGDSVESKNAIEIEHQYNVRSKFELDAALRITDKLCIDSTLFLVFQNVESIPLQSYLEKKLPSLAELLSIAIQLASIVETLHAYDIILHDVRPQSFLIDPITSTVTLSDWRHAQHTGLPYPKDYREKKLATAAAYISPEQTGRMEIDVDERSDIYSLGIVLYELFTGQPPFTRSDTNELVHAHLAIEPIPPTTINDLLPETLSEIILTLIQKKPGDRYQRMRAVKSDLINCYHQLITKGKIENTACRQYDVSSTFKIPSDLYGREDELEHVLRAFDSIAVQSEFICLQGGSGIGKSAFVQAIQAKLQNKNVIYLQGKCDQHNQRVPYGVFAQALNTFVLQWKDKDKKQQGNTIAALHAQGEALSIVTNITPDLRQILGCHALPPLAPVEAQKRLALALTNFLQTLATGEHPLLLFLDDLQWADEASLDFINTLNDARTKHIMIIGASRELTAPFGRPSSSYKGKTQARKISLTPLTERHVAELLADTLGSHPVKTQPLADHIITHTLGNPLFIHEKLQTLHKEGFLYFDDTRRQWTWSLEKIRANNCADSSLALITQKVQRLSKTTQQTLIYAACIGMHFDLFTLAALLDKPDHEVADELREATHENLIHLNRNTPATKAGLPRISYTFVHDQVQQAIRACITLVEKQEIELSIGYFLLERLSPEELQNRIYVVVHYFNAAQALLETENQRLEVAKLNFQAGEKAKSTTAYALAHQYFDTSLEMISQSLWSTDHRFCYNLYCYTAETAYLTRQFEKADSLISKLLKAVVANHEHASIQLIQIQSLVYQQRNKEAVELGIAVLKSLGVTIPTRHATANVLWKYIKSKWLIRGKKPEDLEKLPIMQDPNAILAMRTIQSITASAYHVMPNVYPLLILKMFALSIHYGNAVESPLAYATYGAIVNGIELNNSVCHRFGRVAINMLHTGNDTAIKQRTLLIYNLINRPSGESIHESIDDLRQCYKTGIEQGDLEYAVYTSNAYCMMLCLSGKNLSWAKDEMIRLNTAPWAINPGNTTNDNEALIQYISNLLDENGDTVDLTGEYYDEEKGFPTILKASQSSKLFTCYIFKMHLCLVHGNYDAGIQNIKLAQQYETSSHGVVLMPIFYFYASLLYFGAYEKTRGTKLLRNGKDFKSKLKRWADQVPVNFLHRYQLAQAEFYRVSGNHESALAHYDLAIRQAQENHFVQDEALAHERLAQFWTDRGQKNAARTYISSALDAYKKWGCELKIRHITTLLGSQDISRDNNTPVTLHEQSNPSSLDLATVLKASTTLSSEVVFDKLLDKLMKFVIENAGAQAGYFIIDWGGKLFIEARQSVNDHKSIKLKLAISETTLVPRSIIEHVFQYREDVVLHDARVNNPFSDDPSIVSGQVKSALCIPALNQGKLVGVLYLENNLMSGAFTKDRVELLKLLSGQIAVSIENAILYEQLERKVQERTAEIQIQKEEIQKQKQLVEEKSQFKEQFFANMSHEIRTPMTAIIGMSELIFDTPLSEKQTEYAKGIKYSSENLLAIINDILDYAKIEAGKFSFVNKPFQIRDRITRLQYIVKQLAEEKGITLLISIDTAIPDQLIGDPLRLHQILLNLISNAIKFTEKGNVSVTITQVSANETSVILSFSVKDTGVGIAEEKLNFIFETFSRIEDELNVPGTGLGLFIAKKLVEEQGGNMTVSSKLKEGTAFQFTLPFQRSRALIKDDADIDMTSLSGTKILLVEDTLFNQVVAEEILKKIIHNPQVIIAENGKVALEKLDQHTVDIILMDIKMPVMDGYTASRAIRSRDGYASLPILAFTSNASPGEAEKCKAAGMNDYITKPIESNKLKQKIAALLLPKAETCNF
ncbi:AAA family ATPase [Pseudochryseolinea flava]|uniref:AAA family ATPase n=1 Tax=Pseudochryseolinea flava TaxID=2059302 RepID=UPI00105832FC|nr:AAA family ATPase [Pseudochryseolinea flava]